MHVILYELQGPEMTTHPPMIFALPTLGAIGGDQDMEAQHSRRGKTFRILTPQVPFQLGTGICGVISWSNGTCSASTRGYGTKICDEPKCFWLYGKALI